MGFEKQISDWDREFHATCNHHQRLCIFYWQLSVQHISVIYCDFIKEVIPSVTMAEHDWLGRLLFEISRRYIPMFPRLHSPCAHSRGTRVLNWDIQSRNIGIYRRDIPIPIGRWIGPSLHHHWISLAVYLNQVQLPSWKRPLTDILTDRVENGGTNHRHTSRASLL